jgi:multidrug efflux system outer membrane protein
MRNRLFVIIVFLFIGCLGGCAAVGPNYTKPRMESPAQWSEAREKAQATTALEQTSWWESFEDPILNDLIKQAVQNNLDVKIARERVLEVRSTHVEANASLWPSARASGSLTRSKSSENNGSSSAPVSGETTNTYDVGFDASWELDLFGGTRRKIESARAGVDAGVEDLHDTLLTLMGDVARNYIELRAEQEQLKITLENAEARKRTAELTRERRRIGLTTDIDVIRAEAQELATRSDVPTIEASIKKSIHRLGVLLGKEPNALKAVLSGSRPLPKAQTLMATGLPSELLTRRPDLGRAERKLAAASADIGVATADLYPKFDLTLGMGLNSSTASKLLALSSGYWSLIPEVSMLLFDAGKTRANIAGKQAIYEESLLEYRSAFLKALEDVENGLTDYYTEQTRLNTLADSIRADEETLALANERYRRGLTNFLDVLEAQRILYAAQSNLRKSEAKVLISLVSLYKALGGGWKAVERS